MLAASVPGGTLGVIVGRTGPRSGPAGATAPAHRRAPKALEMSGTGPRSGPAGATAPARRKARSQASGASARRLRENKRLLAPGDRRESKKNRVGNGAMMRR